MKYANNITNKKLKKAGYFHSTHSKQYSVGLEKDNKIKKRWLGLGCTDVQSVNEQYANITYLL